MAPQTNIFRGFLHQAIESWRHRELIYFFAWRDVKIRYKQAAFGAAWAILQPLATAIVFAIFFGRLANVPSDGVAYPLFAYTGLLLWTFFAGVLGQAGQSLVANANLITKVYFPRATLPFASAGSGLLDLGVGLGFLLVMMVVFQATPGWSLVLAPLFLVQLVVLTVGAGMFLSAINVWFRDVKHALPLMIQLWLFVTPVIYPITFIPERYRWLMAFNPLAGIVDGFRRTMLLGEWPDPLLTGVSVALTLLVLVIGVTYFRRTERSFADVI